MSVVISPIEHSPIKVTGSGEQKPTGLINQAQRDTKMPDNSDKNNDVTNAVTHPNMAPVEKLELPTFWPRKVQLWFISIEAQVADRHITRDLTKYNAVIARLEEETLTIIEHIIENPPEENRYEKIKEILLTHYSVSQEKRFRTLVSGLELNERRPSELLAEMRRLGGAMLDQAFAKTLWLDRLPAHVQVVLTAADGLALDALAQLVDKIMEIPQGSARTQIMPVSNQIFNMMNSLSLF